MDWFSFTRTIICGWVFVALSHTLPLYSQLPNIHESSIVKVFVYRHAEMTSGPRSVTGDSYWYADLNVGHGSGVLVSRDGMVVTARHVVDSARFICVWIRGHILTYPAEVVYEDPHIDFAILCIPGAFDTIAALPARPSATRSGENIYAYGYPIIPGEPDAAVVHGMIARHSRLFNLWQLDARVYEGCSGGPVVNGTGEIVGLIVAKLRGYDGINYMQSIEPIAKAAQQIRESGAFDGARQRMIQFPLDRQNARSALARYFATVAMFPEKEVIASSELDRVMRTVDSLNCPREWGLNAERLSRQTFNDAVTILKRYEEPMLFPSDSFKYESIEGRKYLDFIEKTAHMIKTAHSIDERCCVGESFCSWFAILARRLLQGPDGDDNPEE